jgi:hypothetical protein
LTLGINPITKEALMFKFVETMHMSGDTLILVAINELADHGKTHIRATHTLQGGCVAYKLVQI